jgi:hypothetical protein
MEPESLKRLAASAGGEFVAAAGAKAPLVDLYERRILPLARKVLEEESRKERPQRFQLPLAAAFLLGLVAVALVDRGRG